MNKAQLAVTVAHDAELTRAVGLLTNYRFLSALRGPDIAYMDGTQRRIGMALKQHVTARLRAVIVVYVPCHGLVNTEPMTKDDVQTVLDMVNITPCEYQGQFLHYITHLADAVYETLHSQIWGEYGEVLHCILIRAFDTKFSTVDAVVEHINYTKGGL